MKRKIIKINEDLCNGCGKCVDACAEGALQIINGKAKLVSELYCDGFGACLGECPTGALTIEEREAQEFDPQATKEHVQKIWGQQGLKKFEQSLNINTHTKKLDNYNTMSINATHEHQECPGLAHKVFKQTYEKDTPTHTNMSDIGFYAIRSEISQWPVHLRLVSPHAPFFKNKELVILSTCSPIASADVHWRYMRGRSVVVACPKLDDITTYVQKLADILQEPTIPKVIVLRMTVPCCSGLTSILKDALLQIKRQDLLAEEHILDLDGKLLKIKQI